MTLATIAGFVLRLGDAASPTVYTDVEEPKTLSGFGVSNDLVDATHLQSPNATKEYVAGLADGQELTLACQFYAAATQQALLQTAVDNRQTRLFRVVNTGVSPEVVYSFSAVCLSWVIEPDAEELNMITFTLKITGAIT